jgi:hypothetical protein
VPNVHDRSNTDGSNSPPQASQKVETTEFIGHPLHSDCTAPSEFRPPPDRSKLSTIPDLRRCENCRDFSFRKRPRPHRIVHTDRMSLFAFELGQITHLFRRFYGGGSDGIFANERRDNLFQKSSMGCESIGGIRRSRGEGQLRSDDGFWIKTLRLRHIHFDRHDPALPASKLQTQTRCSVERRRSFGCLVAR